MATILRDIILIDEDLCDGCGDCITSCAEGALEIVNGKAVLKADNLCDGAGACLGHCPTGALTVIKKEVEDYDEEAVARNLKQPKPAPARSAPALPMAPPTMSAPALSGPAMSAPPSGCPGSAARTWDSQPAPSPAAVATASADRSSQLRQWPVQLMLVAPNAPYFQNANLVIAADCIPFAYNGFHEDFLVGKALAVACPKLDDLQFYVGKLTEIFKANNLRSVEVLLMEVPCCGGLGQAAQMAKDQAGVDVPLKITTISLRGEVLSSTLV